MRQHFERLKQRALDFYPEGEHITQRVTDDELSIHHTQAGTLQLSFKNIAGQDVVELDMIQEGITRKRVLVEDPGIFKHLETPLIFFVKHSKPLSQMIRKFDFKQAQHIESLERRAREDRQIEKDLLRRERQEKAQASRARKDANRLKYNQKKEG